MPGKHFPNGPVASAHEHALYLTAVEVGSLKLSITRLSQNLIRARSHPNLQKKLLLCFIEFEEVVQGSWLMSACLLLKPAVSWYGGTHL